jgi:hypothetical protein
MMLKTLCKHDVQLSQRREFDPEGYFAAGLQKVFRVAGAGMYQVLKMPAWRRQIESLVEAVERAWDAAERSRKWSSFARAVDRLAWVWIELLEGGTQVSLSQ